MYEYTIQILLKLQKLLIGGSLLKSTFNSRRTSNDAIDFVNQIDEYNMIQFKSLIARILNVHCDHLLL